MQRTFISITLHTFWMSIFPYNIEYCFDFSFCHHAKGVEVYNKNLRKSFFIQFWLEIIIFFDYGFFFHSSKEPFLGCGKLGNWSMLKLQSFLDFSLPLHLFFLGWSSRLPDKIRSSLRKSTKGEGSFKSRATFSFSAKSSKYV